jgi:hypothetical protein
LLTRPLFKRKAKAAFLSKLMYQISSGKIEALCGKIRRRY